MVALIAALGLGLLLALSTPARPLAARQAQPCPPCLDQLPPGARTIATAVAGPDASGTTATLVAYFVRDPTFPSAELGRVGAIAVRSGDGAPRVYRLADDLGELPAAELIARDLNADGAPELGVLSYVGAHSAVLRLWSWSGADYQVIGDFFGDSGLAVRDVDGDGLEEVIVGMRHYDRAQLRHDTVMRWGPGGYEAAYHRWSFTFDDAGFQDYPEAVLLRYYLAIAAGDYATAWSLLGPGMRGGQTQDSFSQGFAGTRDVRVEDLEVVQETDTTASIRVEISSVEQNGSLNRYAGTWLLERAAGAWRLAGAYMTQV